MERVDSEERTIIRPQHHVGYGIIVPRDVIFDLHANFYDIGVAGSA